MCHFVGHLNQIILVKSDLKVEFRVAKGMLGAVTYGR